MSTPHTPGPWSEGIDGNPRVYGPDGMGEHSGLVANVFKGRGNVKLIAAAPDLLAALQSSQASVCYLACEHGSTFDTSDPHIVHSDLCSGMRAAITKAKGE